MGYLWNDGSAAGSGTCLLDDIKTRGAIPTNQQTYTAQRLLNFANAVMGAKVVPGVLRAREAYYGVDYDHTLDARLTGYLIPHRFVGGKLDCVAFVSGNQRQRAVLLFEANVEDYQVTANTTPGFYLKRNRIFPLPSDGGNWDTLRLSGFMRPNKIVDPTTAAARITAINTGTRTLTCDSTSFPIPSSWTTASVFDLLQDEENYDWWAIDQGISAITSTTIQFATTLPTDLAVGDWVSLAGTTPTIQVPSEFHPYLAQEVANICLKAQGDKVAYEAGKEEAKLLYDAALLTITPRVESVGKKLVNYTGMLRRRM